METRWKVYFKLNVLSAPKPFTFTELLFYVPIHFLYIVLKMALKSFKLPFKNCRSPEILWEKKNHTKGMLKVECN